MTVVRAPEMVMDIKRLGAMHQTRLSFMRRLVRQMAQEKWQIECVRWDLNEQGYGTAVYKVSTPQQVFHQVLFADYLPDEERNDRVIAERWDVTMALCLGDLTEEQIEYMREQVPLQEAGRASSNMLVLSRGNKSSRNFEYVVNQLAAGDQPDTDVFCKVGYLFRTTAVYGSGKFGLADWQKVKTCCPDLAYPFAAEMLSCYLLRQFSIELSEYLAKVKSPDTAVTMLPEVKRFLGIGNSTGLGMAPYLIRHPLLISSWVETREAALNHILTEVNVDQQAIARFLELSGKAKTHLCQTSVPDPVQQAAYETAVLELDQIVDWVSQSESLLKEEGWSTLASKAERETAVETQELINSLLLELYPQAHATAMEFPDIDETYRLEPQMSTQDLKRLIEEKYRWALKVDFNAPQANYYFWYYSEEKMEPRLGQRGVDEGEELAMPLVIADRVQQCYQQLVRFLNQHQNSTLVAEFLLTHQHLRPIVKRIQTMSKQRYGEIRVNLADQRMLPLDLLRCKLSFFGVSKFDPKSDRWVRNTMFQGAPVAQELSKIEADDWFMPISPTNQHDQFGTQA